MRLVLKKNRKIKRWVAAYLKRVYNAAIYDYQNLNTKKSVNFEYTAKNIISEIRGKK